MACARILEGDAAGSSVLKFIFSLTNGILVYYSTEETRIRAAAGDFCFIPNAYGIHSHAQYLEVFERIAAVLVPMLNELRKTANIATNGEYSRWVSEGSVYSDDESFYLMDTLGGWQQLAQFEIIMTSM
jgi:hypothetical protein